jgi:hypothetical protein
MRPPPVRSPGRARDHPEPDRGFAAPTTAIDLGLWINGRLLTTLKYSTVAILIGCPSLRQAHGLDPRGNPCDSYIPEYGAP